MARMPGAIWKPLAADWNKQPRMKAYDFFCLHTMVGGLDGTDGYFRNKNGVGYGGTESHFGVGWDGTIYQWQDTDYQADANGNGNWHVISSENADTGGPFPAWTGSDVPALTPQQIEANARIAAWLNQQHGIPLDLTPDSKPGRRGLAVHRWGVPGYMVAGAEQWSSSQGKACPGGRRIAQAPQISARAKQIRAGGGATSDALGAELNTEERHTLDEIFRMVALGRGVLTAPKSPAEQYTGDQVLDAVIGNANPDTKAGLPAVPLRALLMDIQANAHYAARQAGGPVTVDIDEDAIAAALAPMVTARLANLSDADIDHIAVAVADEQARRQAA